MKQQHMPRWNHLYALWEKALSGETFPQFDKWLSEEFRKNPKYGSQDRRWYSEFLFAGVRFGPIAVYCHALAKEQLNESFSETDALTFLEKIRPQVCTGVALFSEIKKIASSEFFFWVISHQQHQNHNPAVETQEPFTGAKSLSEKVSAVLKSTESLPLLLLGAGIPVWFESLLKERVKESHWTAHALKTFLNAQNVRPPLWVRLNHIEKAEEVEDSLRKDSFEIERVESSLRIKGNKGIFTTIGYRDGHFEIQDLASQKIGSAVEARPGQLVWDACAGGGGKTMQIASLLKNKGAVYASDIREYKLEEVKKRARRAGFFNVRCVPWNGQDLFPFSREVQNRQGFDWVLVDAPCSSSGTWRRNPDAKYRIDESNIEELKQLQLKLLLKASEAVRTGGNLVYSTCSWIVAENEGVVKAFLAEKQQFSLIRMGMEGSPECDADTMFAAVLRRG